MTDEVVFKRYISRLQKKKRRDATPQALASQLQDEKERHFKRDRYFQIFREFHYGPPLTDPRSGIIRRGTLPAVLAADRNWRLMLGRLQSAGGPASDVRANTIMRDLVHIFVHTTHPLCVLASRFCNLFQANYYLYVNSTPSVRAITGTHHHHHHHRHGHAHGHAVGRHLRHQSQPPKLHDFVQSIKNGSIGNDAFHSRSRSGSGSGSDSDSEDFSAASADVIRPETHPRRRPQHRHAASDAGDIYRNMHHTKRSEPQNQLTIDEELEKQYAHAIDALEELGLDAQVSSTQSTPTKKRRPSGAQIISQDEADAAAAAVVAETSSEQAMSADAVKTLLLNATDEVHHFFQRTENLVLRIYPELETRLALECVKLSLQEVVFSKIYVPLFALYKRKYFQENLALAAKFDVLEDVRPGDLGVSPQFSLELHVIRPIVNAAQADPSSLSSSSLSSSLQQQKRNPLSMPKQASLSGRASSPGLGSSPSAHIKLESPMSRYATPQFMSSDTNRLHGAAAASSSSSDAHTFGSGQGVSSRPESPLNAVANNLDVHVSETAMQFQHSLSSSPRAAMISRELSQRSRDRASSPTLVRPEPHHPTGIVTDAASPNSSRATVSDVADHISKQNVPQRVQETPPPQSGLSQGLRESGIQSSLASSQKPTNGAPASPISDDKNDRVQSAPNTVTKGHPNRRDASRCMTNDEDMPYAAAIRELQQIEHVFTPAKKLECIVKTSQAICTSVDTFYEMHNIVPDDNPDKLCINADDLLSIFAFVLIKANVAHTVSEANFIDDFCTDSLKLAKPGYFLATLQAAVQLIQNIDSDSVTSNSKLDVTRLKHDGVQLRH
jgi:Vacuolar sorting protein 9 (VPS9) domain